MCHVTHNASRNRDSPHNVHKQPQLVQNWHATVMSVSSGLKWLGSIYNDPLAGVFDLSSNWIVQKVASVSGLTCLPAHAHEILLFAGFYFVVHILSAVAAPLFVPQYRSLKPANKHGFDAHVVSHVNAILLCVISFPMFFSDNLRTHTSYTPYSGFVVSAAVGYFLWDLVVTLVYYKYNGFGFFLHAIVALYVFLQALRPFMMDIAAPFIWFEASTPFVNINWFGSHVPNMISPATRQINGFLLLIVFFLCRIVAGPVNGYRFFSDTLVNRVPSVPYPIVLSMMFSFLIMISLNFYWFYKMLLILVRTIKEYRLDKKYDLTDRVANEATSSTRKNDNGGRRRRLVR